MVKERIFVNRNPEIKIIAINHLSLNSPTRPCFGTESHKVLHSFIRYLLVVKFSVKYQTYKDRLDMVFPLNPGTYSLDECTSYKEIVTVKRYSCSDRSLYKVQCKHREGEVSSTWRRKGTVTSNKRSSIRDELC